MRLKQGLETEAKLTLLQGRKLLGFFNLLNKVRKWLSLQYLADLTSELTQERNCSCICIMHSI